MRYRVALFLTTVLFLIGNGLTQNAEDNGTWYWAWHTETRELVSYNPNGEVHHLNIFTDEIYSPEMWRIDANTSLLLIWIELPYRFTLYKLTPDTSQEIKLFFEAGENFFCNFEVEAVSSTYAVLLCSQQIFILNLAENSLTRLGTSDDDTRACLYPVDCVRLSANGQELRYISTSVDEISIATLTIRERILATGEERIIYTYPGSDENAIEVGIWCQPDTYGEVWLCKEQGRIGEEVFTNYWLVYLDGAIESLVEDSTYWRWTLFFSGDDLMQVDHSCRGACPVEIIDQKNEERKSYTFPDVGTGVSPFAVRLEPDQLLFFNGSEYYVSSREGVTRLGFRISNISFPRPDRWLMVTTEWANGELQIWDVLHRQIILDFVPQTRYWIDWSDSGFVVHNGESEWAYFYGEQRLVELPTSANGGFYQVLPYSSVLYAQCFPENNRDIGIYRYSPEDNIFVPLVPNIIAMSSLGGYCL